MCPFPPISMVDTCHPESRSPSTCRAAVPWAWPGRHLFLQGSSQASRHELIRAADARKGGTEVGKQAGLPSSGHCRPPGKWKGASIVEGL